jgi:hypothetical protein
LKGKLQRIPGVPWSTGCQRKKEGELWLDFSEGQSDDGSKPTQKENIHEKSFHSYIYRQIGPLG